MQTNSPNAQEQQVLRIQTAGLVLARLLLSAPDRGLLGQLQNPEMLECWPLTDEQSLAGVKILNDALDDAKVLGTPVEDIERVNADYLRLFGRAGKALAEPHESVWLSDDHLVFEAQTLQVRQAYSQLGLGLNVTGREPDDHIGFQISFITQVASKIREAFAAPTGLLVVGESCCKDAATEAVDQRDPIALASFLQTFLKDHTLQFSSQFASQLREHAHTAIYRGTADLVEGLLTSTVAYCCEVTSARQ